MSYQIQYKSVFSSKGNLAGYAVFIEECVDRKEKEGYLTLFVDAEQAAKEYNRLVDMLTTLKLEIGPNEYFTAKHPLDLIDYVRGVIREKPKGNAYWKKDVGEWSVNLRGERV